MKLNFLDKCAKIATISTCILNANDNKNTSKAEIQLTDNFVIQARYSYSICDSQDVMGPFDVHSFDVSFFRDGQLLDRTSFGTYGEAYTTRSLCDENKDLQFKLEWLRTAKPDFFERVRFMSNRMTFTNEELVAIEQKADELENIVNEINQNKGRGR
ncbi:MAG: hypothetical protein J6B98_05345 [Bacilli bacterium]|nr:hypothetical protein [Bacilli bacterium]